MRTHPTMRFDDVLVIFEGRHRVTWQRRGLAHWTPVAVWPDNRQAAAVRRHLAVRQPLLVVAERPETTITVLDEQLAGAPASVLARVEGAGEVADLRLPAFDWLPTPLRERGLEFLRRGEERAARTPPPLLQAAQLEPPVSTDGHVRFLHVARSWPHLEPEMEALIEVAFVPSSGRVASA